MLSSLLCSLVCALAWLPAPDGLDLPLAFRALQDRRDPTVRFVARRPELTAYVRDGGLTLVLPGGDDAPPAAVTLDFGGAGRPVPAVPARATVRSYRGADPSRWDGDGQAWSALRLPAPSPGAELLLHERDGLLVWDLELAPGADPRGLTVSVGGALGLCLEGDALVLETAAGPLVQTAPVAWQVDAAGRRHPVTARFELRGPDAFGLTVPDRDPALPLVVDPGLVYGTVLGGSEADRLEALALEDGSGHVLVTGSSTSLDLPVTAGAQQPALVGLSDVVVARLDPAAGQLVWATYLGGTDGSFFRPEEGRALALAGDGSVVVAGTASSSDFPTTPGAAQPASGGGDDAFVARLAPDGSLVWSTLLGGGNAEDGLALALDAAGVVTVAGATFSNDFPTTPGAFDESFNSLLLTNDLFVTRLAADGGSLVWSTLVGGSLRDEARDLLLDAGGRPIVVGLSGSSDFPTTAGAYDESFNGSGATESDAVALRLSADGSALEWATFVGSLEVTEANAVAASSTGDLVLAGTTQGADFPVTPGARQTTFGGGLSDAFVCALSADGASLRWSTFLGGQDADDAMDLALDGADRPTVVGGTRSPDLIAGLRPLLVAGGGGATASVATAQGGVAPAVVPVGPGQAPDPDVDGQLGGDQDGWIARLTADGGAVVWAGLHGGAGLDEARALVLDGSGAAWVAGRGDSPDLPVTADGLDTTPNGGQDGFLARFAIPPVEDLGFGALGPPERPLSWHRAGRDGPAGPLVLELDGARPGEPLVLELERSSPADRVPLLPRRADDDGRARWELPWPASGPAAVPVVLGARGRQGARSPRLVLHPRG